MRMQDLPISSLVAPVPGIPLTTDKIIQFLVHIDSHMVGQCGAFVMLDQKWQRGSPGVQ